MCNQFCLSHLHDQSVYFVPILQSHTASPILPVVPQERNKKKERRKRERKKRKEKE